MSICDFDRVIITYIFYLVFTRYLQVTQYLLQGNYSVKLRYHPDNYQGDMGVFARYHVQNYTP